MFNFGLYKSNKKYLIFSFIAIVLLIVFNALLDNKPQISSNLSNGESSVNELVISEIMTSNKGAYIDSRGDLYDWVELYNGSSSDINLKDYGLSDDITGKIKWVFPEVTIESKGYLIIFLSDVRKEGLYANFSLKQDGGELLTLKRYDGKVIDSVKTVSIDKNSTMARDSEGSWIITDLVTPGYPNNEKGREDFLSSNIQSTDSNLLLNEFLPANEGNIILEDNKLYSYVEVINTSSDTINLSEYYLSDDKNALYKWRLPNISLNSNETYLIYMNSLDKDNNASFDLKHKTGTIILSNHIGVVEKVEYTELSNGLAYVKEDSNWLITSDISPGYLNNTMP